MDKKEFSQIRRDLGKTQKQMAQLLGTSLKAVQSFEQGWRDIPVYVERQALFLMALKSSQNKRSRPCWVVKRCSEKIRHECSAWELQLGITSVEVTVPMLNLGRRGVSRGIFWGKAQKRSPWSHPSRGG